MFIKTCLLIACDTDINEVIGYISITRLHLDNTVGDDWLIQLVEKSAQCSTDFKFSANDMPFCISLFVDGLLNPKTLEKHTRKANN